VLLFPCAVTLAVLAEPILRLLSASASRRRPERCRYWGRPVVVLGNVLLIGTLIGARLEPRVIMRCFVVAFAVVTLGANLALIAWLGAEGAALAMLLTRWVFGVMRLRVAGGAVGMPSFMTPPARRSWPVQPWPW